MDLEFGRQIARLGIGESITALAEELKSVNFERPDQLGEVVGRLGSASGINVDVDPRAVGGLARLAHGNVGALADIAPAVLQAEASWAGRVERGFSGLARLSFNFGWRQLGKKIWGR